MQQVFITGATGFIGSYIAKALHQRGYLVHGLRRSSSQVPADLGFVKWHIGDVNDLPAIETAMSGASTVVHAAAIVSFLPADRDHMLKVNVDGTANMLTMAQHLGVHHFVQLSSIAALGKGPEKMRINEQAKWEGMEGEGTFYGLTKHLSEVEVWRAAAEGLPISIVNPALVLGLWPWEKGSNSLLQYVAKERPFYSKGTINIVDVRDVAEAVAKLVDKGPTGERYVLSGHNLPFKVLFDATAELLGKKPPKHELTPLLGAIAWRVDWLKSLLPGMQRSITKEVVRNSFRTLHYDGSYVTQALGLKYHEWHETLRFALADKAKHKK